MNFWRRTVSWGCGTILVIIAAPIVLAICAVAFVTIRDVTCWKVNPVPVLVNSTRYRVPAELQPTFSPLFRGRKIREVWQGKRAYCPSLGQGFVPQASVLLDDKSLSILRARSPGDYPEGHRARNFSLAAHDNPLNIEDTIVGPPMFGRPSYYRCFEGYYGPGETCRFYALTPDGALVSGNIYPRGTAAENEQALRSVERVIVGLRAN